MSKASMKRMPINNLYYFDKGDQKHKFTYDQVKRATKYITRANDRTKTIGNKQAAILVTDLVDRLNKSENGSIYVDHDYLSSITDCLPDQNTKIIKQLADILDFQYHRYARQVKQSYCYEVKYTHDGEDRIKNPELFYDVKPPKNEERRPKNIAIEPKPYPIKIGVIADKNQPSYIDIRDKEEIKEKEELDPSFSLAREVITKFPTNSKTPTKTNEEKTVNTEKIKPITQLSSEIFRNFDTQTSEEIIENCVFEEVTPSKIAINIKPSFAMSGENKQKIKSCIRKLYGEDVQMVNASSTVPQKPKFSVAKVAREEGNPPETRKNVSHEWGDMKTKILERFPLDYYDHLKSAWLDNLNFIRFEDEKIIVRARAFYIDEIFQRFSHAIELAVLNTKKSLVIQYENNDQRPIEFLYKQILNKSKK